MPRLDLRIVGCKNLPDVQTFGKIDPFCTVELEHKKWQTSTAENTQNPEWNEVFKFNVGDPDSSQLIFTVWNDNAINDDFLGCYRLSLGNLDRNEVEEKTVLLQQCKNNAELTIRIKAVDFGDIDENERQYETPLPPNRYKQANAVPESYYSEYRPPAPAAPEAYNAQTATAWQAPPSSWQAPPMGSIPPNFNPNEYISLHADLQAAFAGQDPVQAGMNHWRQYGHNEGRAYSRSFPPFDFNPDLYFAKYPDVAGAVPPGKSPQQWAVDHWMTYGVPEGRRYR